jgi:hypothetical protein
MSQERVFEGLERRLARCLAGFFLGFGLGLKHARVEPGDGAAGGAIALSVLARGFGASIEMGVSRLETCCAASILLSMAARVSLAASMRSLARVAA